MSSDRRWTGGAANREWQRGTAPGPRAAELERGGLAAWAAEQARAYLAGCRMMRALLDPRYHPTADGMVKIVWCRDKAAETALRAAYNALTSTDNTAKTVSRTP